MPRVALALVCTLVLLGPGAAAPPMPEPHLVVLVKDSSGAPVADAAVEALARHRSLAVARTDAEGAARLFLPAGATVRWIVALRSGVGLDYRAFGPAGAAADTLEGPMPLTLDGARTIRIRAVDVADGPVKGARLVPWMISKEGRTEPVNLSASFLAGVSTDGTGTAVFDWIPRATWDDAGCTFMVQGTAHHWSDPPEDLYPAEDDVEITARLHPTTTVTGTVTLPGGGPAHDVLVIAEGRGDTVHPWRGRTRTRLDGSYVLPVAAGQAYAVAVIDDRWTARTAVRVRDGAGARDVDLALTEGVLIHGRLARNDGAPVSGELVLLGTEAEAPMDPLPSGYWQGFARVALQRSAFTDDDGRFAFRVGPGDHLLCAIGSVPGGIHDPLRVTVPANPADDIRVNFTKDESVAVLGTSAAPFKVLGDEVFEYAFQPAWTAALDGANKACMQCHRPSRPVKAGR